MPQISIIDKVRAILNKQPLTQSIDDSIKWYRTKIRELSGYGGDPHYSRGSALRTELLNDTKRGKTFPFQGFMYLFVYDPKLKKTLPYYDKFPLVFPIQFYDDGFLGINLHYLGYRSRLLLFNELATLANKPQTNSRARLVMAYKALRGMARFKAFKPCIKRYLDKHIISNFIKIDAPDWETAIFLPVENFAKKPKIFVWSDSEAIISGAQSGPTVNTSGLPKDSKRTSTKSKVVQSESVSTNGLPKNS